MRNPVCICGHTEGDHPGSLGLGIRCVARIWPEGETCECSGFVERHPVMA